MKIPSKSHFLVRLKFNVNLFEFIVEGEEQYSPLPRSTLSATALEYNANVVFQSNILPPLPQDILLFSFSDENDWKETERCLTEEIGYPMKLLI